MKFLKVFIIVFVSFSMISLNAQIFVGGNIALNTNGTETDIGASLTHKSSNFSFGISPTVGKFLSEKMAIGIALDLSHSVTKTKFNIETISKSSSIGINPFLRYYAIKWNNFAVYGQGNIDVVFENSSTSNGGTISGRPKQTIISVFINPGLSYDIGKRLSLEININILSLGYSYNKSKDGSNSSTGSNFSIGAGLGNIVTVGAITIGGIYKF